MIFVTGGSASGKSAYAGKLAERLAAKSPDYDRILYIATLADRSKESVQRVERHRKLRRNGNYEVAECFSLGELKHLANGEGKSVGNAFCDSHKKQKPLRYGAVLFDSLDDFTADVMFGAGKDFPAMQEPEQLAGDTMKALMSLKTVSDVLIVVSDALYSDGVRYDETTRWYMSYTAGTERLLAEEADHVVEVVFGIPLLLKGKNHEFLQIADYNAVSVYEDSHALG